MHAKPGDSIEAGAPLFTLHTDEPARFERALEILEGSVEIVPGGVVNRLPLVLERIEG
jgi:thymidine phosphorylase